MPTKTPTPKNTVKIRRLPKQGEEITIKAVVTRLGRNSWDTGDTVTVRIAGYDTPVTISADYLERGEE